MAVKMMVVRYNAKSERDVGRRGRMTMSSYLDDFANVRRYLFGSSGDLWIDNSGHGR